MYTHIQCRKSTVCYLEWKGKNIYDFRCDNSIYSLENKIKLDLVIKSEENGFINF